MNFLFEFSFEHCIAICAFLVPANLLLTLWTILLARQGHSPIQTHLVMLAASLAAFILLLHDFTWFAIGVVMAPTYILLVLGREYVDAFSQLYEPKRFLDRAYRHYRILGEATYPKKGKGAKKPISWVTIRALLTICWRQGVLRTTRWSFWRNLWNMGRYNPGGISSYLAVCAQIEHFVEYREIVKREIEEQVAQFLAEEARAKPKGEKLLT